MKRGSASGFPTLCHSWYRKLRLAEDLKILRLAPDFETLCPDVWFQNIAPDAHQCRGQPDAMIRNQKIRSMIRNQKIKSGGRFWNVASDTWFWNVASDTWFQNITPDDFKTLRQTPARCNDSKSENCVWRKILKCCILHLILICCVWRVISKREPDITFWNQVSGAIICKCPLITDTDNHLRPNKLYTMFPLLDETFFWWVGRVEKNIEIFFISLIFMSSQARLSANAHWLQTQTIT